MGGAEVGEMSEYVERERELWETGEIDRMS